MLRLRYLILFAMLLAMALLAACGDDEPIVDTDAPDEDLIAITYAPTAYVIEAPSFFPAMDVPADNPTTEQGVALGRRLFYDPILSDDGSMSCASCHAPSLSFTDGLARSPGVTGQLSRRNSMSLLNIGYVRSNLMWDGKSSSLEDQALLPVADPIELHSTWPEAVQRIRDAELYPAMFREAFGIERRADITPDLVTMALAQFERTLVSSGNSKFDRVARGEEFYSDDELNGFDMFFDVSPNLPDAECGHCHAGNLLTIDEFFNNGLDPATTLDDFTDKGLGGVTGKATDNGKFRAPTLRNITLTAPYMHDGRFQTLEEVIDHYNDGGHYSPNLDPLIKPIGLTEVQKAQLLAFLRTLEDPDFVEDERYQSPF